MMKPGMKLKGFKGLDKALSELPEATARNNLRKVGKAALEPMADAAAANAPEDEGRLAFSIDVSEKRTRRAKTRFSRREGVQIAMGPASGLATLQYASFVEFGTVDTPAQPFMRPAWDQGAQPALNYVEDNLADLVSKSAERLAKKHGKTGG